MWEYRARHTSTLDGDTVRLTLDLGFSVRMQVDVRLLDVHAPELVQPGGLLVARYVADWMIAAHSSHLVWPLLVRTVQTSKEEPESIRSFTRYVGEVWFAKNSHSLNDDVRRYLAEHPEWSAGK